MRRKKSESTLYQQNLLTTVLFKWGFIVQLYTIDFSGLIKLNFYDNSKGKRIGKQT